MDYRHHGIVLGCVTRPQLLVDDGTGERLVVILLNDPIN